MMTGHLSAHLPIHHMCPQECPVDPVEAWTKVLPVTAVSSEPLRLGGACCGPSDEDKRKEGEGKMEISAIPIGETSAKPQKKKKAEPCCKPGR
jgi:hypothetical protein